MSTHDLLHKVELCALSDAGREALKAVLRELLEEHLGKPRAPAGALGPDAAAAYIGLKKTAFYARLKADPTLKACAFVHGKRGRRFVTTKLDAWMDARTGPAKLQEEAA